MHNFRLDNLTVEVHGANKMLPLKLIAYNILDLLMLLHLEDGHFKTTGLAILLKTLCIFQTTLKQHLLSFSICKEVFVRRLFIDSFVTQQVMFIIYNNCLIRLIQQLFSLL